MTLLTSFTLLSIKYRMKNLLTLANKYDLILNLISEQFEYDYF